MKEITLPAKTDCLDDLLIAIDAYLQDSGIDESNRHKIILAAEEIFVNIASYAYPAGEGNVTVRYEIRSGQIMLEFKDSGKPYNPLNKKAPDLKIAAEHRPLGGLGIHLVKELMDEVRYEYRDGQNILTVCKNK